MRTNNIPLAINGGTWKALPVSTLAEVLLVPHYIVRTKNIPFVISGGTGMGLLVSTLVEEVLVLLVLSSVFTSFLTSFASALSLFFLSEDLDLDRDLLF